MMVPLVLPVAEMMTSRAMKPAPPGPRSTSIMSVATTVLPRRPSMPSVR